MQYLLLLGSNHRRAASFRLAVQRLQAEFVCLAHAGPLPTRDAGSQSRYLNAAAIIESSLPYGALQSRLKAIEAAAGRDRNAAVCTLDIDLVAQLEGRCIAIAYKPADLEACWAQPLLRQLFGK